MAKHNLNHKPTIVYKVTNKVNGKTYIGCTTSALSTRKSQHFSHARLGRTEVFLHSEIRLYGEEAFEFCLLESYPNRIAGYEGESHYIELLKPEYNKSKGGAGSPGHAITEEQRSATRARALGNSYHLGHKHSEENKEKFRQRAYREKEKWQKEYAHLGPKASSKKVICIDDGLIHESASAAARYYKVARSALIELCLGQKGRKTVGKLKFKYLE